MYYYKEGLINGIKPDKPDPAAAKVLQEALGGQFGEMRTMMQYFFQSSNFRGKRNAVSRFNERCFFRRNSSRRTRSKYH